MKKILVLLSFLALVLVAKSQVSISTGSASATEPHESAVLDLQSTDRGLLLPRVQLSDTKTASPLTSHVAGMTVYNTATAGTDALAVSPGLYYNDGTKWVSLPLNYTKWFYMPSVAFDTQTTATAQTKDLYKEYLRQFGGTSATNTTFVSSAGAPAKVPYLPSATDLYYYITDYDANVFSNVSIDANGLMTYDVTAVATDESYINIVFVLK